MFEVTQIKLRFEVGTYLFVYTDIISCFLSFEVVLIKSDTRGRSRLWLHFWEMTCL